jgi:phage-related protein
MADADGIFREDYGMAVTPVFVTNVTPIDAGGLGIRGQKVQTPTYKISFRSVHFTKAEADAVTTFFESKKGQRVAFTWTNPDDSVVYTCRFASDTIPRSLVGYGRWEFNIEMIGVK